jgi:hypothetical protein
LANGGVCAGVFDAGRIRPALAQTFTTTGNNYITGINVTTSGTVTLDPGVQVFVTPGNNVNQAVAFSTGTGPGSSLPATLTANNAAVTITTTVNTSSALTSALFLHPILGNATITASGIMDVAGGINTNAIWAATNSTNPGDVASVNYNGSASATNPNVTDITVTGTQNSSIIQACANDGCGTGFGSTADGDARIDAAGNLKGTASSNLPPFVTGIIGLDAVAGGDGKATVIYR